MWCIWWICGGICVEPILVAGLFGNLLCVNAPLIDAKFGVLVDFVAFAKSAADE